MRFDVDEDEVDTVTPVAEDEVDDEEEVNEDEPGFSSSLRR